MLEKVCFQWKSNVHEWVGGGKLLSVTLRHNDRGKTLPYMGIPPTSLSYLSPRTGLALYDAHIWRSSALPSQAMRSLLKEQTFFGSFSRRSKNAIGLKPTMGGQLLSGTGSGHILGSFRSYFIHNGLWRAEILESEQIFGKSFVHRSREEASWENPQELMSYKSTPLSVLPSWNILSET